MTHSFGGWKAKAKNGRSSSKTETKTVDISPPKGTTNMNKAALCGYQVMLGTCMSGQLHFQTQVPRKTCWPGPLPLPHPQSEQARLS